MANETTENELNQTGEPGTEYFMETLPGQDRYVAPLEETPLQDVDSVDESAPATSMWADAWRTLRRNPLFIISGLLILFIIVVAIAPGLFTKQDPNSCDLGNSLNPSSAGHPFGFDLQGCDVYTRVIEAHRKALAFAGEADPITEDLLIGQTAELEKFQWFIRAFLENSAGEISE